MAALALATATLVVACQPSGGTSPAKPSEPQVRLDRIADLDQPLALAVRSGDPTLYVAEKVGLVVAIRGRQVDPTPVLDLSNQVSLGGEQGLLGIAFSADGRTLFADFTDTNGETHVVAFAMQGDRADPASRRDILFVHQPYSNHNGGNLVFGPDGDLYVGLGDGGSGGDPQGNGQSLATLLGKILRIRPQLHGPRPYTIPADNPFVHRADARAEIWAYGLRNPWRFSFDRTTGDLWIGDVGQSAWEEVDRQPGGSAGGQNYGWNRMEGSHPYAGASPPAGAVPPVYEYSHDGGGCVVTGGYVYRGTTIPGLVGAYVFGDFCLGDLEALRVRDGRVVDRWSLGPRVANLSSFGEDASGELYALSLSGGVYRLVPA